MSESRRDLPEGVADLAEWRARRDGEKNRKAPEGELYAEFSQKEKEDMFATAQKIIDRYADQEALLDNYKKFPAQFSTEGLPLNASMKTLMEHELASQRRIFQHIDLQSIQAVLARYELQEGYHPGVMYLAAAERARSLLSKDFSQF